MIGDDAHLDALRARKTSEKPCVAITMGDPSGIGAEVIAKALADPEIRSLARFIIYGMEEPLDIAAGLAELSPCWIRCPHDEVSKVQSGVVLADYDEFSPGLGVHQPNSECGAASLRFVEDAIQATRDGIADVLVTGPIHKVSWRLAGCKLPGHTELLSKRFNCKRVTMMFAGGPLKVALATTHVGLFELRNIFTIGRVFQPIDLFDDALRRYWGIQCPRIAVTGLNPHAGDGGRFGDEESRIIEPAILIAREHGIRVEGPFAADSIFRSALEGRYDGVVAMYHDQGLIPIKLLAFETSVNITLGLPVIRTSVDHGPAFDIAGKNKADPGSMKSAIRLACILADAPPSCSPRIPMPTEDQSTEKKITPQQHP